MWHEGVWRECCKGAAGVCQCGDGEGWHGDGVSDDGEDGWREVDLGQATVSCEKDWQLELV